MEQSDNSKRTFDSEVEKEPNCTAKRLCVENNEQIIDDSNIEYPIEEESIEEYLEVDEGRYSRAREHDVGIIEFINDLPGFNAVMKKRYSDFLVNEITQDGKIVHLTNLVKHITCQEIEAECDNILDDKIIDELEELAAGKVEEVSIEVTNKDKSERKKIHVMLRKKYPFIESNTVDKGENKLIVVKKIKGKNKRFVPPEAGNYIHFVLYKENRDTLSTINKIASLLRVMPKLFSYAGTKDKRGKTSQLVSAYRLSPQKLLRINNECPNIRVGNIVHKPDQIKLGDLSGNHFVIILREVNGEDDLIKKAINSLIEKGFINYYGLQRFGTSSIATHTIGKCLLLGRWKSAIGLILAPKPEDDEDLANAKKIWLSTHDAKLALQNLARKWSIEGKLLSGIANCKENDYVNALNAIPRNMRLLYIHSYQSYIWNKVVSKRIQKYGLKVLKGDLVPKEKDINFDVMNRHMEETSRKALLTNMVRVLSEGEAETCSLSDVLLPLPGHSVVFPQNEIKEWYDEFLKEDKMSWSDLDNKNKVYSLSGAYRHVIVLPQNVAWEIIPYNDFTQPLAPSDLDLLQQLPFPKRDKDGSYKALKLEFDLPSSCYATMAVREVTKNDTGYSDKDQ